MRYKKRIGGGSGSRRRSGKGGGDSGPDLFAAGQLAGIVKSAFENTARTMDGESVATPGTLAEASPPSSEPSGIVPPVTPPLPAPHSPAAPLSLPAHVTLPEAEHPSPVRAPDADETSEEGVGGDEFDSPPIAPATESIPARMLNEFVYCPRLFHYEHVQGVFVESVDTVKGSTVHKRVDKGKGALPEAQTTSPGKEEETREALEKAAAAAGEIHSKSVMLGSERLGVVAKMDLVEATLASDGTVAAVCPVDYKVGAPKADEDGLTLWDADRMQLGLQCLVLRDNGYQCDTGIIYYRKTKQKVPLEITPELEAWVLRQIAAARVCAAGPIPPPLIDSPKCARCSLAPVCLPDETRMLSIPTMEKFPVDEETSISENDSSTGDGTASRSPVPTPRRLIASRSEKRALYLNTQGYRVGCNDGVIKVKEKDRTVDEVRAMDVEHVALFGNIQVSTQAIQRLCDADIPVTWFSMGGWFYGITRGHSLKNVLVRIEQFRYAADPANCLRLAQQFVRGKIHNHRVLFMRNHIAPPERTKLRLGQAREDALATHSLEELLGVEGAAAAVYFQQFGGMLREEADDDYLEGLEGCETPDRPPPARLTFDFSARNRRPPTDPVNALLSLAYSLLAKECTLAANVVGLDPYVGFYHQPRHGRPALALDLMEEFRPIVAESAVLTAINNRYISPIHFVTAGRAVNLNAAGRKQFFQCFEQRMNHLVTHPVFDYKVSYRRAIELQFRILARVLTGEIPDYVPFLSR